jgi:nitrite reductase/ring-hydroxylating ferredoxin subunit
MPAILHPSTDFDQITVEHPRGFQVILVKVAGTIHAYRNRCPHVGVGLDWGDGRCRSGDNELICAMHGATFAADTGFCTGGPCSGDRLEPIAIAISDGRVMAE